MSTGNAIALAVAVIAAIGLIFEWRSRKAGRDISIQQLDLLRRQVEAEAAARLEHASAEAQPSRLVAVQGPASGGGQFDSYTFTVTNAGPAAVFALRVWAAAGAQDKVGEVQVPGVLLAEADRDVTIDIPRAASDARGLSLWAAWTDDAGAQTQQLLEIQSLR